MFVKKLVSNYISNVLVIGCGGAGLRSAIEICNLGLKVCILGKRAKNDSHTVLAAGGINAAFGNLDDDDSWEQHFADTYIEGYGIGEAEQIELLTKDSLDVVQEIDSWGAKLAKLDNGKISQRFFGAHTYRRTCYAGDYTGKAILNALLAKTKALNIPIFDNQYVTKLLVENGRCFGAVGFDINTGEISTFIADCVILASGGHTRIWDKSSSRKNESNGDGFYLALDAGCSLKDMEMVQFHPTGMVIPDEYAGTLVTEAVRGEGGILLNNKGERFMKRYDEKRMELSSRDQVAIANYMEILNGNGTNNGGIYLDISHKNKDFILEKIPKIYRLFLESQMLDISKKPMEVAPTAHYSMGGIEVNPSDHQTAIEGLFAVGEVAGGLHGANRLGGNSLSEILVFGKRAGKAATNYSLNKEYFIRSKKIIDKAKKEIKELIKKGDENPICLQNQLGKIMWEYCGVIKNESSLKIGLAELDKIKKRYKRLDIRIDSESCRDLILAFDIKASIISAEATIRSSLAREETRGAHQRSDYPNLKKDYQINLIIKLLGNNKFELNKKVINPLKGELLKAVKNTKSINSFKGRLLE